MSKNLYESKNLTLLSLALEPKENSRCKSSFKEEALSLFERLREDGKKNNYNTQDWSGLRFLDRDACADCMLNSRCNAIAIFTEDRKEIELLRQKVSKRTSYKLENLIVPLVYEDGNWTPNCGQDTDPVNPTSCWFYQNVGILHNNYHRASPWYHEINENISKYNIDLVCSTDKVAQILEKEISSEGIYGFLEDLFVTFKAITLEEHRRLKVAMQEALANATYHGNLGLSSSLKDVEVGDSDKFTILKKERLADATWSEKVVKISMSISDSVLEVTVTDEGSGFNYNEIANTKLSDTHGRGLILIRNGFDEVQFENHGRSIIMRKQIQR